MKILYLSGREITYSRNRIILNILRENHRVRICTTNFKSYPVRLLTTFLRFIYYNLRYDKDLIFVGFFGQPFVLFVKLLSSKRILFDAYLSMYNTLVEDRKIVKNYFLKKFVLYYEKIACLCSDLILMDTNQHIKYMKWRCKLSKGKFRRLLIGVDDTIFKKRRLPGKSEVCNVYYHGTPVPLQGAQYIIKAAKLLENEDVFFHIIGDYKKCERMVQRMGMNNIKFYGRKDFSEMPSLLSQADIGLGIFGNTLKTQLVVPNKVYELSALGMPIITSNTSVINDVFEHRKNIYLCEPANPESLAKAIVDLKDNGVLRERLSENVYKLCHDTFSINALARDLNSYIGELT